MGAGEDRVSLSIYSGEGGVKAQEEVDLGSQSHTRPLRPPKGGNPCRSRPKNKEVSSALFFVQLQVVVNRSSSWFSQLPLHLRRRSLAVFLMATDKTGAASGANLGEADALRRRNVASQPVTAAPVQPEETKK
jgi:hypothetical protein